MDERGRKRKLEQITSDDRGSQFSIPWHGIDDIQKEYNREILKDHTLKAPAKKQKVSRAEQAKKSEGRQKREVGKANGETGIADAQETRDVDSDGGTKRTSIANFNGQQPAMTRKEAEQKEPEEGKTKKEEAPNRASATRDAPRQKEPELNGATLQPTLESDAASSTLDHAPQIQNADGDQASVDSCLNGGNASSEFRKRVHIKVPDKDRMELFRERLHAKLAAFREARGARPDGQPVRSREDLLEARRQEQAKRKAKEKERRRKAKEEEDFRREKALKAASQSPLGSLSPSIHGEPSFSFGRIKFSDGTQISRDLSYTLKERRKGPSDPKSALAKVEKQKARLAGMDDEKRKEVEEKEQWLNARRKVEGDKVKDDGTLLKKALKRKEKAKKKSANEWRAREKGVKEAVRLKQKKRQDNLRKRREEKALGKLGKEKGKAKRGKARPGFEGCFKLGGKK